MAGISGLDDFMKDLNGFVDNVGKLDGISVSIEPTDTRSTVEQKLRAELRRKGATGFSDAEIHGMSEDLLKEARNHS